MRVEAGDRRQELIEAVSNVDDTLAEIFLGKLIDTCSGNIDFFPLNP